MCADPLYCQPWPINRLACKPFVCGMETLLGDVGVIRANAGRGGAGHGLIWPLQSSDLWLLVPPLHVEELPSIPSSLTILPWWWHEPFPATVSPLRGAVD